MTDADAMERYTGGYVWEATILAGGEHASELVADSGSGDRKLLRIWFVDEEALAITWPQGSEIGQLALFATNIRSTYVQVQYVCTPYIGSYQAFMGPRFVPRVEERSQRYNSMGQPGVVDQSWDTRFMSRIEGHGCNARLAM